MATTLDRTVTLHKVTDSMIMVDGPTVVVGEHTRQINRIAANTGVHSTPRTPADWSISAADLAAMDQPTYDVWADLVRLL